MAGEDSILSCAQCGATIVPRINKTTGLPSKAPRKYCSSKCRAVAAESRRPPRPDRKGRRVEGFCPSCGLQFVRYSRSGDDAGEYCARDCYFKSRSRVSQERAALRRIARRKRKRAPISREQGCSVLAAEVAALKRIGLNAPAPRNTVRPCSWCKTPTIGTMNYRRTCDDCKRRARREWNRNSPSRRKHKRIYRAKRRAIERGAQADRIDPIKVFERDKWKCHMCGRGTPRRLRGTYEARAPELDHVLPLAAGGTHTWGNVRCACRECNLAKGSQPLGQLGLPMAT